MHDHTVGRFEIPDELLSDSAGKDILIRGTDLQDWLSLLDFLEGAPFEIEWRQAHGDGFRRTSRPRSLEDIVQMDPELTDPPYLVIEPSTLFVTLHFYYPMFDQIMMTVFPQDLRQPGHLDTFLTLIQAISNHLDKAVDVLGVGDQVLMRVVPEQS